MTTPKRDATPCTARLWHETLHPFCDRDGCTDPPDDTITVGMIPKPNGETPWVHERCTRDTD